jgi:hypothetical protein
VSSDSGNILITLDRKAEADLRLLSLPDAECLAETGALLAEEEDSKLLMEVLQKLPIPDGQLYSQVTQQDDRISIQTKAFTPRPETSFETDHVAYVDGWVENKSNELDSRFERKVRGIDAVQAGSVGKIRLDEAADQALQGFSDDSASKATGKRDGEYLRPLLAVVGTNKIKVETVSWLGAIARRYGLEETERDLGRTASRKGRPLAPPPSTQ